MKKIISSLLIIIFCLSLINTTYLASDDIVKGDLDNDKYLTATDASMLVNSISNNMPFQAEMDMNGDGEINLSDSELLLKRVLNSNFRMPIEGNIIFESYELTPANFQSDTYFEKIGEVSIISSSKIRLTDLNSLNFSVEEGASLFITARHASSTTSGTRTVKLLDENGNVVASKGYEMGVSAKEALFATNMKGNYTICADNHIDVTSIKIVFGNIENETTTSESITETTTELVTEITTTGNAVYVTNFEELKKAAQSTNVDIYIKNDIYCSERIKLSTKNAKVNLIGVTQADSTSPSLDFSPLRDKATSASSSNTGVLVSGTHYNFENLIIENAGDAGIRITGSGSGHCILKNCIFRYNNNSGVSVTNGGEYNTFIAVDSYRNGDIYQKLGADADGFSVKLNAGECNYFYNCRAWENSDDGWDSYDRGEPKIGSIYYVECLAWHNGSPEIFTGEYDYEQGYPLDKKLIYVQAILKQDPNFEEKYNNKEITSWPNINVSLLGSTQSYTTIHSSNWGGNPNGFKFGSAETTSASYRYIENCIAFGHKATLNQPVAKGYDQNNGYARYDIVNGLSFDNVQNYWMDRMSVNSLSGVVKGFNGEKADATDGTLKITTPSEAEQNELRAKVYQYRDEIYDMVYNDIIPGIKLCDVF